MEKKVSLKTALSLILAAILLTSGAMYIIMSLSNDLRVKEVMDRSKIFPAINELDQVVRENYNGEMDDRKIFDSMALGYLAGVGDPYSYYLSAEDYLSYKDSRAVEKAGIGIDVIPHPDNGTIYVVRVFKDSPADKAGLKHGDEITAIDGEDVVELGYAESVDRVRGDLGEAVKIELQRDGLRLNFEVERGKYITQSVLYEMIDNIGYVHITTFADKTADQFLEAIEALVNGGAKAVIFDVRNNTGGSLNEVQRMVDRLVPEGTVIYSQEKGGEPVSVYESDAEELDLPMAVLVNGNTASASELFACDLRDFDKAVLVGTKTYGKGAMQRMYELESGGAVSVTFAKFNPHKSENFHGEGLEPDHKVELTEDEAKYFALLEKENDPQLQKALEILKEKI